MVGTGGTTAGDVIGFAVKSTQIALTSLNSGLSSQGLILNVSGSTQISSSSIGFAGLFQDPKLVVVKQPTLWDKIFEPKWFKGYNEDGDKLYTDFYNRGKLTLKNQMQGGEVNVGRGSWKSFKAILKWMSRSGSNGFKIQGSLAAIWGNKKFFLNWLKGNQSLSRISKPLNVTQAQQIIDNAKKLGIAIENNLMV